MPQYEVSGRSTITTATAGTVLFGLRAGGHRMKLLEVFMTNVTAPTTSGGVGLVRFTADGATWTSVSALPDDPGDAASTAFIFTAATTPPTTGGVATTLRRWHHGTAIGNGGSVWTWDRISPLVVSHATAATAGLAVINLQATVAATYDFSFRWIE